MTKKQRVVLVFIERYLEDHGGVSPSYQEIIEGSECKSKAHVRQVLLSLARNGYISRLRHRARAITILKPVAIRQNYRFDRKAKKLVLVEKPTEAAAHG
jgi:SOS-response transcriptional repressor LexA